MIGRNLDLPLAKPHDNISTNDDPLGFVRGERFVRICCLLAGIDVAKHVGLLALGQAQPWSDAMNYWSLATQAAHGDWWMTEAPVGFRTPGYPWFLAICQRLAGNHALLSAVIIQHIVAMITAALAGIIAYRISRSPLHGILVYAACVFMTARDQYANFLLTEVLATVALTASHAVLVETVRRRNWWWYWGGAGILAMGILLRPALVAAIPTLLLTGGWLAWQWRDSVWKKLARLIAGPLLLTVFLVPWCLRNYALFGRFTLTTFVGRELWTAHFSPWPGGGLNLPVDGVGADLLARIQPLPMGFDMRHNWSVSPALTRSGLNDAEADALMSAVALEAIQRQPIQAGFRSLARCATFWYVKEWSPPPLQQNSITDFQTETTWHQPAIAQLMAAILPLTPERQFPFIWTVTCLCWLGVFLGLRLSVTRPYTLQFVTTFVTMTVLTGVLEIPLYRYRLVIEPLIVIVAVQGVLSVGAFVRQLGGGQTPNH